MKKRKSIAVVLAAVCIVALFIAAAGITEEPLASDKRTLETKSTGSMNSGDALIELRPRIDSKRLIVEFRINTHSVNLNSIDMKEMTTLEYGGRVLKPAKASRVGGHHTSGTILFHIDEDIKGFTIRIKGIPNVDDRVYEWG